MTDIDKDKVGEIRILENPQKYSDDFRDYQKHLVNVSIAIIPVTIGLLALIGYSDTIFSKIVFYVTIFGMALVLFTIPFNVVLHLPIPKFSDDTDNKEFIKKIHFKFKLLKWFSMLAFIGFLIITIGLVSLLFPF